MQRNIKVGAILLAASMAVLATLSEKWASVLGIGQSSGLIGLVLVYAILFAFVLGMARRSNAQH